MVNNASKKLCEKYNISPDKLNVEKIFGGRISQTKAPTKRLIAFDKDKFAQIHQDNLEKVKKAIADSKYRK